MKTTSTKCQYCNNEFTATRSDAKYCSVNCKQNAYFERAKAKNEKIKADALIEQEEIIAKKVRITAAYSAELIELQKQVDELANLKIAQKNIAIEKTNSLINDAFKQIEEDNVKRKIENANRILREWLQQLLEFDQEEKTSLHKAKSLFERIISSCNYTFSDIPSNYKQLLFIKNVLIPKAKSWYDSIQYSRERYICIHLSEDTKEILTNTFNEIDS